MKGTHAILQAGCQICFSTFEVGEVLTMRVTEKGVNPETGNPSGVMIEYLHESCILKE